MENEGDFTAYDQMFNPRPQPHDEYELWVCEDCYFAHHYGAVRHEAVDSRDHRGMKSTMCAGCPGRLFILFDDDTHEGWTVGDDDRLIDLEPLGKLDGLDLWDWTDSNTGEGIEEFSRGDCQGCGSPLGGSRHRLKGTPCRTP